MRISEIISYRGVIVNEVVVMFVFVVIVALALVVIISHRVAHSASK